MPLFFNLSKCLVFREYYSFREATNKTLDVIIDNEFTINVTSLEGIFILKLSAFSSRNNQTNKDADDLALIISNYLEINQERAINEHYDLYQTTDFSTYIAGATLLGRDMKSILDVNIDTIAAFIKILENEIKLEVGSPLINQMIETHKDLKYEETLEALQKILEGLKGKC